MTGLHIPLGFSPCDSSPLIGVARQVFDPALLPSNAIISSGSVNVPSPFPYTASAGFCGAQCGNSYAVYLVAEDLQEPPNRQDTVLREVLFFNCSSAPSARLYSNATEVCTQEFLVGRAKLALALSPGSAGFPTGPTVPLLGSVRRGFKVRQPHFPPRLTALPGKHGSKDRGGSSGWVVEGGGHQTEEEAQAREVIWRRRARLQNSNKGGNLPLN